MKIVPRIGCITGSRDSHNVIRLGIRISIQVNVHSYFLFIPNTGEEVELTILHRVGIDAVSGSIGAMVIPIHSPVRSAIEESVLCS